MILILSLFIFHISSGGPGSRKGRIVDDLQSCYGFHHIYTEDIIYREFPRKMANVMKIETVNDIKEAIEVINNNNNNNNNIVHFITHSHW